jgi:carboxymethylenebutenolidase
MGGPIQWREPPASEPRHFATEVDFGTRRSPGTGYLYYSQRSGPGVLVLHEFFGLQESFKNYAARLSETGFTVLAPDLYDGVLARDVDDAIRLRDELDDKHALNRVEAAADFLVDNWHPRLGVVGFSLGASFADAVARSRPVEATVFYYGSGEKTASNFSGPLLAHLASDDEWTPVGEAREVLAELEGSGVDVETHVYPGTGHWFANPAVDDAYVHDAAEIAFDRTVDFLRHHLA